MMYLNRPSSCISAIGIGLMLCCVFAGLCCAKTHHRTFVIQESSYTRLCNNTKSILAVNGSYPGPTISARKGDTVYVKVINRGDKNITIHWHGVNEPRDPWSDGPEYVTQCPIQPGASFTQRIRFTEEEGTLWWHAHSEFDRATVYGAIVILPKLGSSFPFRKPHREFILMLGEWWNKNITDVYETALKNGGEFENSDANTINGQPGDFMPCSANDTFKVQVEQGKFYLLRVINAALNTEFFFTVSGHNITVVGTDGSYTKPYVNEYIMITPGQTMDLLVHANQFKNSSSPYRYYIIGAPYFDGNYSIRPNTNLTVAILDYKTSKNIQPPIRPVFMPLPIFNDTGASAAFTSGLRSLASSEHPANVPKTVDVKMFVTLSVNEIFCPNMSCAGIYGNRVAASMNNASFQTPEVNIDILDAYYKSINGVYTTDFPDQPPLFFDFTSNDLSKQLMFLNKSTKVKMLEYNQTVEIVFQGTNILGGENHPMHLHGHSFYVVGSGFGNFNKKSDPLSYNLVDPPYQNTVGVLKNGWTTIRFRAANPGVWYMHCHYDRHTVWGMDVVFITKDGKSSYAKMLPPPADKPPC